MREEGGKRGREVKWNDIRYPACRPRTASFSFSRWKRRERDGKLTTGYQKVRKEGVGGADKRDC